MENEEKTNEHEAVNDRSTVDSNHESQLNIMEEVAQEQAVSADEEEIVAADLPATQAEVVQPMVESVPVTQEDALDTSVDKKADTENPIDRKLCSLTLKERQMVAIEVAAYFAELQQQDVDFVKQLKPLKSMFPALYECDEGYFPRIIKTVSKLAAHQRNNFFTAYVLFYIISAGKYPHEYWKGATEKIEDTILGEIRNAGKEFSSKFSQAGCGRLADKINEITKSFQRQTEYDDIASMVRAEESVGIARIYELFWEVFVMKYGNYRPSFWKNKLTEFHGKKYAIRESCEYKEESKIAEIYAVSYEGKLSKPLHYMCEDCSLVTVYDENTWLAISADGVGSCENSYLGSQFATEMLSKTIAAYLNDNHFLVTDKKRKGFGDKLKPVDADSWAKLMYFLRFELANKFYDAWESAVQMSKEFKSDPKAEIGGFTTTLQFAFGCEAFIACGRIGDGSFFVRKKECNSNGSYYGGTLLDDCISGVMQTAVLTVAHLKTNPSALQVDFFRPGELTDIIISSDGVSSALGYTIEEIDKFACRMHALPFEKRCEELSWVTRSCSDYNETQHGSGDDCTIVYISLKS